MAVQKISKKINVTIVIKFDNFFIYEKNNIFNI